jgi:hypothetical protein
MVSVGAVEPPPPPAVALPVGSELSPQAVTSSKQAPTAAAVRARIDFMSNLLSLTRS